MTTTGSIAEPLKGMFNVELTKLSISGEIVNKVASYAISGQVRLGGSTKEEQNLTGGVLFSQGQPRAVMLTNAQTTSTSMGVEDFSSKVVQPGAGKDRAWPSDAPSFRFESATISYVSGAESLEYLKTTYNPGLSPCCVGVLPRHSIRPQYEHYEGS